MKKGKLTFGYKRLSTEQWLLPDDEGVIQIHPYGMTCYSTEYVEVFYKIGKKFKEQQYSDLVAYKLKKI